MGRASRSKEGLRESRAHLRAVTERFGKGEGGLVGRGGPEGKCRTAAAAILWRLVRAGVVPVTRFELDQVEALLAGEIAETAGLLPAAARERLLRSLLAGGVVQDPGTDAGRLAIQDGIEEVLRAVMP